MKQSSIAFFLAWIVLLTALSCKKDNINGDPSNLEQGAYLALKSVGNLKLNYKNIDTSTISFSVSGVGSAIDKINVYVVLGSSLDPSKWKLLKTVAYTNGVTISTNGGEIAKALGINSSDINVDLTLYNEVITKDGRTYSIANTPSTYESLAGYKMAMHEAITLINYVCPYNQAFFSGSFLVQSDGWQDYSQGDAITVTPGPGTNQITLQLYPAPGVGSNRKSIVADVNPATDSVTVKKQVYGDYPGSPDFSASGIGTVSACSGIISLILTHYDDSGGVYGPYTVVLKK